MRSADGAVRSGRTSRRCLGVAWRELAAGGAACSGPAGPGDGAAMDVGALDATDDAAAEASGDAGVDAAPPVTTNPMLLSSGVFNAGTSTTTNLLFVNFIATPGQRCAVAHAAGCYVVDCRETAGGDAGTLAGVPAGQLSATTTALPSAFSAPPDVDGLYDLDAMITPHGLWTAGDHITLTASGATIPPFHTALDFPPTLTVTAPMVTPGSTVAVARTMGFTVTWSATTASTVVVGMQQAPLAGDPHNRDVRFICEFPGAAGTGTVPTSVLGVLESSGATVGSATLFMGTSASTDLTPGGYAIHAYVANAVMYGANVF